MKRNVRLITKVVNRCRYSVKPIRIEYFGHVLQMDQSESRIFTFHSDDVSKTAWAPENEFVVKERWVYVSMG